MSDNLTFDIISDKLTGITAFLTLVSTTNDPTLIASIDTVIVVGYMALASSVRVNDDTMHR
jgi:hypothetical protein